MQEQRCPWCGTDPLYIAYHDDEWGVPEWDARALWEKLILDGFQAGLSWITILKKRDSFRAAFAGFAPETIAHWGEPEVTRLLADPGIVRHRGKIEGTIRNARAYVAISERISFSDHIWDFMDGQARQNRFTAGQIPTQTPLSEAISKSLKQQGNRVWVWVVAFRFFGIGFRYRTRLGGPFVSNMFSYFTPGFPNAIALPETARLHLLRPHHRLCVHASCGHGQRPSGHLPGPRPHRASLQGRRLNCALILR